MWTKLDDNAIDHPKTVGLSDAAWTAWIKSIVYCNKHLTDGAFPESCIRNWSRARSIAAVVNDLVCAGLWLRDVDDKCNLLHVHDFLDWNPSREQVLSRRTLRSEAGRKGGKQKPSKCLGKSTNMEEAKRNPVPEPDPTPSLREAVEGAPPPASTTGDDPRVEVIVTSLEASEAAGLLPDFRPWVERYILSRWADSGMCDDPRRMPAVLQSVTDAMAKNHPDETPSVRLGRLVSYLGHAASRPRRELGTRARSKGAGDMRPAGDGLFHNADGHLVDESGFRVFRPRKLGAR